MDHDEGDDQDMCTLVVGLMQKNRRIKRKMGLDSLTIGFAIYQVTDGVAVNEQTDTPIARSKQMFVYVLILYSLLHFAKSF